jgi:hypothetical protein
LLNQANTVMGIRMKAADSGDVSGSSAFSQDILKIEINGPDVSLILPA